MKRTVGNVTGGKKAQPLRKRKRPNDKAGSQKKVVTTNKEAPAAPKGKALANAGEAQIQALRAKLLQDMKKKKGAPPEKTRKPPRVLPKKPAPRNPPPRTLPKKAAPRNPPPRVLPKKPAPRNPPPRTLPKKPAPRNPPEQPTVRRVASSRNVTKKRGLMSVMRKKRSVAQPPSPGTTKGTTQQRKPAPNQQRKPAPNQQRKPTPNQQRKPTPNQQRKPTPNQQRKPTPNQQRKPTPSPAAANRGGGPQGQKRKLPPTGPPAKRMRKAKGRGISGLFGRKDEQPVKPRRKRANPNTLAQAAPVAKQQLHAKPKTAKRVQLGSRASAQGSTPLVNPNQIGKPKPGQKQADTKPQTQQARRPPQQKRAAAKRPVSPVKRAAPPPKRIAPPPTKRTAPPPTKRVPPPPLAKIPPPPKRVPPPPAPPKIAPPKRTQVRAPPPSKPPPPAKKPAVLRQAPARRKQGNKPAQKPRPTPVLSGQGHRPSVPAPGKQPNLARASTKRSAQAKKSGGNRPAQKPLAKPPQKAQDKPAGSRPRQKPVGAGARKRKARVQNPNQRKRQPNKRQPPRKTEEAPTPKAQEEAVEPTTEAPAPTKRPVKVKRIALDVKKFHAQGMWRTKGQKFFAKYIKKDQPKVVELSYPFLENMEWIRIRKMERYKSVTVPPPPLLGKA